MSDKEKLAALERAAAAARAAEQAAQDRDQALRAAAIAGASLREIALATGIPHMTVKRSILRAESG